MRAPCSCGAGRRAAEKTAAVKAARRPSSSAERPAGSAAAPATLAGSAPEGSVALVPARAPAPPAGCAATDAPESADVAAQCSAARCSVAP